MIPEHMLRLCKSKEGGYIHTVLYLQVARGKKKKFKILHARKVEFMLLLQFYFTLLTGAMISRALVTSTSVAIVVISINLLLRETFCDVRTLNFWADL
jgi:hypothetical protein